MFFTIHNIGNGDLDLTGSPLVNITGDNPGDFVVIAQPATDPVPSVRINTLHGSL